MIAMTNDVQQTRANYFMKNTMIVMLHALIGLRSNFIYFIYFLVRITLNVLFNTEFYL